ncbi:MAG: right-handed parallel beta-helix repeat-containing protein [Patescibacteria group bacterium]|jgi:hypothetical protein
MENVNRKKHNFRLFVIVFIFLNLSISLLYIKSVSALQYHGTNITANEFWSAAQSPHIVTKAITVSGGAILTIEAGATVLFNSGASLTIDSAKLIAIGASGQEITFSANSVLPTPGSWNGIYLRSGTYTLDSSILERVIIEYATDGLSMENYFYVINAHEIRDSEVRNNKNNGIRILAGYFWNSDTLNQAKVSNVYVHDNGDNGIYVYASGSSFLFKRGKIDGIIENSIISNNAKNGIYLNDGQCSSDVKLNITGNVIEDNNQGNNSPGTVAGVYQTESRCTSEENSEITISGNTIQNNNSLAMQIHPRTILVNNNFLQNYTKAVDASQNVVKVIKGTIYTKNYSSVNPGSVYTWSGSGGHGKEDVVYFVSGLVTIINDNTLNFVEAPMIKLGNGAGFFVNSAKIYAVAPAVSGKETIFTSINDSAADYGGDTRWVISSSAAPAKGDWGSITLSTTSYGIDSSVIDHAIIKYGTNGVVIDNSSFVSNSHQVLNSIIGDNSQNGITIKCNYYWNSAVTNAAVIKGNKISNNDSNGIYTYGYGADGGRTAIINATIQDNNIVNSGGSGIQIDDGGCNTATKLNIKGNIIEGSNNKNGIANAKNYAAIWQASTRCNQNYSETIVEGNTIRGNNSLVMQIHPRTVLNGNTIQDNNPSASEIFSRNVVKILPGGVIKTTESALNSYWSGNGDNSSTNNVVYLVSGNIEFTGGHNLYINNAATVKFVKTFKLSLYNNSKISAFGLEADSQKNVFTSVNDNSNSASGDTTWAVDSSTFPVSGDWNTIFLGFCNTGDCSVVSDAIVRYATNGITLDSDNTHKVYRSEISNCLGVGILVNASPTGSISGISNRANIDSCKIHNNNGSGISVTVSGSTKVSSLVADYTNNEIYNNAADGIKVRPTDNGSFLSLNLINNNIHDNSANGVNYNNTGSVSNNYVNITSSKIINNIGHGVYVISSKMNITGSDLYGNHGAEIFNGSSNLITAENNYWGDNFGPWDEEGATNPKNKCRVNPNTLVTDYVGTGTTYNVDYSPWTGLVVPSVPDIDKIDGIENFPAAGVSLNPTIESAITVDTSIEYTDWNVYDSANQLIWSSNNTFCPYDGTTGNGLFIVHVNSSEGSFVGSYSGESALVPATDYYVRARYRNRLGISTWSEERRFRTTGGTVAIIEIGGDAPQSSYSQWPPTEIPPRVNQVTDFPPDLKFVAAGTAGGKWSFAEIGFWDAADPEQGVVNRWEETSATPIFYPPRSVANKKFIDEKDWYMVQFTNTFGQSSPYYFFKKEISWLKTGQADLYSGKNINLKSPTSEDYNASYCVLASQDLQLITLEANPQLDPCRTASFDELKLPSKNQNRNYYYSEQFGILDINGAIKKARDDGRLIEVSDGCSLSGPTTLNHQIRYCHGDSTISGLIVRDGLVAGERGDGLIIVDGDLTVDGDITYQGWSLSDTKKLASLGIIVLRDPITSTGGNINISSNVQNLAGAYYAEGTVDTCYNGSSASCSDNRLVVNGLLAANQFNFKRTYSDSGNNPAEEVNYDGRILINTPPGMDSLIKGLPLWSNR